MRRASPLLCCALAAILAGALLVSNAGAGPAGTGEPDPRIAEARDGLEALEQQLIRARDEARDLEEHLAYVNGLIDDGRGTYAEIDGQLADVQTQIDATRTTVDSLQGSFDEVVRHSYINGGSSSLVVLFQESDPAVAEAKLAVIDALAMHQLDLAKEVAAAKESLQAQTIVTEGLLRQQGQLLAEMRGQRENLIKDSDQLQRALDTLDRAHDDLLDEVAHLKQMLSQSDLERLQETLQGKDSINYWQWAKLFLGEMKAPQCKENQILMIAWQAQEGTDAKWNPLATTYTLSGSTIFNWVGVKNYASLADGLKASRLTLENGSESYGYDAIVKSLRRCEDAEDTASAIGESAWCGNCPTYMHDVVAAVRNNFNFYSKL